MYLSRVSLAQGPGAPAAWAAALKQSARQDQSHRLIWTLFAKTPDTRRDFLWREIEPGSYFILSPEPPRDQTSLWKVESKKFEPELRQGDRLAFSLRANPAIRIRVPGQKGKRVDIIMHTKRPRAEREQKGIPSLDAAGCQKAALDWLFSREQRFGASFDRSACSILNHRQVVAGGAAPNRAVRFTTVDYQGLLTVAEPAAFLTALKAGIGKAKAYGCGLMLVRRA